jgi:serine/threonine protein kinase
MNPLEQACDTQRIDDYLANDLSTELQLELESHLSTCETCRQQIEHRAAEPDVWNQAAQLLSQTSHGVLEADELAPHNKVLSDAWDQPTLDSQLDVAGVQRQAAGVLDSLAPTDDPNMLGRIGEYEISGVVGVGGMGAVLKGFDKSLRRVVAVKVMAPYLAGSGSARARFQREARAAAAITHDNVIDIYAVSEASGLPYLVMPYARGPSLQKRIDDGGPLAVVEVVRIGRQIASGLAAAHEQGLVHRDIKPANILLSDGIERLWITDFGVARAMDDVSMTQTGLIAGTPQYMSPEQARGETVDHRSDLFSLGSVLYTACTGRPPFRSEAAYGILRRITDTDPRPLREINSDIPEWLCVVIDRLLAKHPADRFESAEEVVELLDGCLAHLQQPTQIDLPQSVLLRRQESGTRASKFAESNPTSSTSQRTASPPPQLQRSVSKRRGLIMIGSLLLAALLGVCATQLTNPADITGHWTGENWQHVALSSVEEASDWYSGSFTDADGRRGALRLEWSRLQRRYNGRWKVGEVESGQITLRLGNDGALRGAVSVDPESKTEFDVPRLREFAWQPASEETKRDLESTALRLDNRNESSMLPHASGLVIIRSPIEGNIVRVSEKIRVNAEVKKGELIAELSPVEETSDAQRREQLDESDRKEEASFASILARENDLEAAKEVVDAIESRVENLREAKYLTLSAAEQQQLSAVAGSQRLKEELVNQEAVLDQTRLQLAQTTELYPQGLVSELELKQAEAKLASQQAKVEKFKASVNELESEISALEQRGETKRLEAQARLDTAIVELKRAEADVVKFEAEIQVAKAEWGNQKSLSEELRKRLAELRRIKFFAPQDGVIIRLLVPSAGGTVKEGDIICELAPGPLAEPPPSTNTSSTTSPVVPKASSLAAVASQIPPTQSLSVFGPASELVKRLREAQKQITDSTVARENSQRNLATCKAELEELREKASHPKDLRPTSREQLAAQIQAIEVKLRANENGVRTYNENKRLAESELAEALAERDTIIAILMTQRHAAEQQLQFQAKITSATTTAFQAGRRSAEERNKAEQALERSRSEIEQLQLLLGFYSKIGDDGTTPEKEDRQE